MSDTFSAFRGSRKLKKDLSCHTSLCSVNSTVSEGNGGRDSLFPGLRAQRLITNISLEKSSFHSDKDVTAFEKYELDYSTYLLRKLQNKILEKNKKEKSENLKKYLVSMKFEFEDSLKKNVQLNRELAHGETYVNIIKECNKRIELSKVLDIFEEHKLDTLFKSVSNVLDGSINQIRLIGINKNEMENVFTKEVISEDSELIKSLRNIEQFFSKNKENVENIAKEITQIEKLINDNLTLRKRCANIFDSISLDFLETNYDTLTQILKRAVERRKANMESGNANFEDLFKFDELLQVTQKQFSTGNVHSLQLSKINSICSEKPSGTSTPQIESHPNKN